MRPLPEPEVVLEIPARAEYVSLARLVVAAAAQAAGLQDEDRVSDLKIAVSEACTNAVEAHARKTAEERVVIRCSKDPGSFQVLVTDRGPGLDLTAAGTELPTEPLQLVEEGGLGIALIRALVDEVEFSSSADGTEVRMVVKRS